MRRFAICVALVGGFLASVSPSAMAISAPAVTAIHPTVLAAGITTTVTVTGSGFLPGATLTFRNADFPSAAASAAAVGTVSATHLTATITTSAPGSFSANVEDVIVTNPDTGRGVLARGLTVNPVPVFVHASPYNLARDSTVDVSVTCNRCNSPAVSASAGAGVTATVLGSNPPFLIRVAVSAGAPLGEHQFTISTADRGSVRTDPPLFVHDPWAAADLTVASPGGAFTPGSNGSVGVSVRNAGPAAIGSVSVTLVLPPGFTYSSSTGLACSVGGDTVACAVPGTLAAGQQASGAVVLHAARSAVTRSASLRVSGDLAVAESNLDNNAAVVTLTVPTRPEGGSLVTTF